MEGPDGVKRCPDCGEAKAVAEFGRNKRVPDGRARYCKECFGRRHRSSYRKRRTAEGKTVREPRVVPEDMKYCPRCEEPKPLAEFGRNRATRDGRTNYCKPCHSKVMAEIRAKNHGSSRNYLFKLRYGVTEDEVDRMIRRTDGRCPICRVAAAIHVDHDHETGRVRGVLCFKCNGGLGQFKDDAERMCRAADYLEGDLRPHERPQDECPQVARWKTLAARYHLTGKYRIRIGDVERLIEAQGGVCPICGTGAPEHVDHCHATGVVRGVLCHGCNTGLGQLWDDADTVRNAALWVLGPLDQDPVPSDYDLEYDLLAPDAARYPDYPDWTYEVGAARAARVVR